MDKILIAAATLFTLYGLYILMREDKLKDTTEGKILSCKCNRKGNSYKCFLTVKYKIQSDEYLSGELYTDSDSEYIPGRNIDLYYNPNNPVDCRVGKMNRRLGWIMIIMSLLAISLVVF